MKLDEVARLVRDTPELAQDPDIKRALVNALNAEAEKSRAAARLSDAKAYHTKSSVSHGWPDYN